MAESQSLTSDQKKLGWMMLAVLGFVVVAIIVVSGRGAGAESPKAKAAPTRVPVGTEAYVYVADIEAVTLAVDQQAHDALDKAMQANDTIGYAGLSVAGRIYRVDIGTKVLVIDHNFGGLSQVRVLNGPRIGRSGWLPFEWVVTLPAGTEGGAHPPE